VMVCNINKNIMEKKRTYKNAISRWCISLA
jgi:hypothetical protein